MTAALIRVALPRVVAFAFALVSLTTLIAACGEDPDAVNDNTAAYAAKAAPKLNLSHIACTEEGDVLAHFVLLFAGSGTPGNLSGVMGGDAFGPVAPGPNTGNVWHYNVTFPAGAIDITSATTTTSSGATVTLHNPSEYSGDYECGNEIEECPVEVPAQDVLCVANPFGSPDDECAALGLALIGKDDNLTGLTHTATVDAYAVLIKSGTHGCENGDAAYRVTIDVQAGDTLNTPADQDISHVTYCACPDEEVQR
jgi:hypothetical protein